MLCGPSPRRGSESHVEARPQSQGQPLSQTTQSLTCSYSPRALGRRGPGGRRENRNKAPPQARQHVQLSTPHGGPGHPHLSLGSQLTSKPAGKRRAVTQQLDTGQRNTARADPTRSHRGANVSETRPLGLSLSLSLSQGDARDPAHQGQAGMTRRGQSPSP